LPGGNLRVTIYRVPYRKGGEIVLKAKLLRLRALVAGDDARFAVAAANGDIVGPP
jgi:hypothetical protein